MQSGKTTRHPARDIDRAVLDRVPAKAVSDEESLPEESRSAEEVMEAALKAALSANSMQDLCGLSSEMMDSIYAHAYSLYQSNQLDQAESIFRFLCIYDFHNIDYSLGLGAVYQLKKDYQKAIEIYSAAYIIGNNDLRPVFHAGQCCLISEDTERARQCFELVLSDSQDPALQANASAYIKLLTTPNPRPDEATHDSP